MSNHIVGKVYDVTKENMNKLISEIENLKAQVKYWEDKEVERASCCVANELENIRLKRKLDILKKALEFYGDNKNWRVSRQTPDRPLYEFFEDDGTGAGAAARLALKEADGLE